AGPAEVEQTTREVAPCRRGEVRGERPDLLRRGLVPWRDRRRGDAVARPLDRERASEVLEAGARRPGVCARSWGWGYVDDAAGPAGREWGAVGDSARELPGELHAPIERRALAGSGTLWGTGTPWGTSGESTRKPYWARNEAQATAAPLGARRRARLCARSRRSVPLRPCCSRPLYSARISSSTASATACCCSRVELSSFSQ